MTRRQLAWQPTPHPTARVMLRMFLLYGEPHCG